MRCNSLIRVTSCLVIWKRRSPVRHWKAPYLCEAGVSHSGGCSGPLVFGLSKGGLQVLDAPEPACPTYERRKEVQLNAGISLAVVSRASGVLTVHCSLISSEFSPL